MKSDHKTSELRMSEILRRCWTFFSPVQASNCLILESTKEEILNILFSYRIYKYGGSGKKINA